MRQKFVLFAALILLAVIVSGGAADQPMADLPDQVTVETGTLWLYGQEVAAPFQFQKTEGIWHLNGIQVVPKPGRPIEERVRDLDDVEFLLQEIGQHLSLLQAQGLSREELAQTKADLLNASVLVDSAKVLPTGNLEIKYRDDPYPSLDLLVTRQPETVSARQIDVDQEVYRQLIEPLRKGCTVYYSVGCQYLKVPPGKTLAESDLPQALQRELESFRQSQ